MSFKEELLFLNLLFFLLFVIFIYPFSGIRDVYVDNICRKAKVFVDTKLLIERLI